MKTTTAVLAAALAGLFAMNVTIAADGADNTEKCYGIAKAGKNDCAANGHSCAGQSKKDSAPSEWVKLPKGTCERIVGASTAPMKK